jgi:hypothetical protein
MHHIARHDAKGKVVFSWNTVSGVAIIVVFARRIEIDQCCRNRSWLRQSGFDHSKETRPLASRHDAVLSLRVRQNFKPASVSKTAGAAVGWTKAVAKVTAKAHLIMRRIMLLRRRS